MNVASSELCQKLYELSEWELDDKEQYWYKHQAANTEDSWWSLGHKTYEGNLFLDCTPAYDAGFLLRKLPQYSADQLHRLTLQPAGSYGMWAASYDNSNGKCNQLGVHGADTLEDALCKLAIELFKAGILQKGDV